MQSSFPEPKTKAEAVHNWTQFEVSDELAESLVVNNFKRPTNVQG